MPTDRFNRRLRTRALLACPAALLVALAAAGPAAADISSSFDSASGTLVVAGNADDIVMACTGGEVKVNGGDPIASPLPCPAVVDLLVDIDSEQTDDNLIDLSGVRTAEFTQLERSSANGDRGDDVVIGSGADDTFLVGGPGDDRIVGFTGNDVMIGGDGDDTMVWNNGDGSDVMDGEAGDDTAEVNGAGAAGDAFTINPNGQRVRFDRTNLGQFSLDIGTTESLQMSGGGGDDTITGTSGLAQLIKLRMNGGDGNDTLIGSDGDDVMDAGAGDDTMVCGAGHDVMAGADGYDTMVWNNGDGSDTMHGQAGNDTAEVNGAPSDGDAFKVEPTGNRVRFDRVNLVPFSLDIATTERMLVNAGGGDDRIIGGDGLTDLISGSFNGEDGDDRIRGTDGQDLLSGGTGSDRIRAKDRAEDQVDCGRGIDFARVDTRDVVRGCNLVVGGGLRARPSSRPARVTRSVAALRLRCVDTERCQGTVRLLRRGKALAAKRFDIKHGSSKTVRAPLNRRGRRLVARASREGVGVQLRIDARDRAGNGWRSTAGIRLTG